LACAWLSTKTRHVPLLAISPAFGFDRSKVTEETAAFVRLLETRLTGRIYLAIVIAQSGN
jgi:hypothetical protein